jgi:hypothetical protein
MDALTLEERDQIGGNQPPVNLVEAVADPFDAIKVHMDDLYLEAANWCDGAPIENADQAAAVDRLIADFRDAIALAEGTRDAAIVPLNEQVKAIRVRWYPLIGETKEVTGIAIRARKALLAAKTKWAAKLAADRAAEAERLRLESERKAQEARAALQAAPDNLSAIESAEALLKGAKADARAAKAADKPATKGMRTEVRVVISDPALALRTSLQRHREEMLAYALQLAERDARDGGVRRLDGFTITEERVAFR